MDKKALQSYATWSKQYLEQQIELSLKSLGIHSDEDIRAAKRLGDVTVIEGNDASYPAELYSKRESIISLVNERGYENIIEEFAYTWFNRFIALRYMEIHGFLSHGFRVLSNPAGGIEPEILKNLSFVKSELNLDMELCSDFTQQGKIEELFQYVIAKQCNALSEVLPMLFSSDMGYLDLLLPKNLLKGDTVITRLIEIPEDAFEDEIEIIGWMYQFYISAKKKAVNDSKEIITKDTLPAVTQLFTPDWIVRYMAQNSLGRLWLESYPNSSLRNDMEYYVDDAPSNEKVKKQMEEIKYKNVNPEEVKVIEPCCGSGHILVYVFDLLLKMYEERGYQKREIPSLILKNNIVGLDIDKRASQLASFSLIMKARSINNRFFDPTYYVKPRVYELKDSQILFNLNYEKHLNDLKLLDTDEKEQLIKLVDTFKYGKTIGSLSLMDGLDFECIDSAITKIDTLAVSTLFNVTFLDTGLSRMKELLVLGKVLSNKYDIMITNPPYRGVTSLEDEVKQFALSRYPDSKTDLFAMFIDRARSYTKKSGFSAFLTPYVWMFIQSYEKLRNALYSNCTFETLIQFEYSAFEEATVPICTFVLRNTCIEDKCGCYLRLTSFRGGMEVQRQKAIEAIHNRNCGYFYEQTVEKYYKIPGAPLTYWATETARAAYSHPNMGEVAQPRHGLATSDNDRFLKLWHEIDVNKASLYTRCDYSKKWFPMSKGGDFRRWYGNLEWVINYEDDGREIKDYAISIYKCSSRTIQNTQFYFKEGLTWSALTSGGFSVRYQEKGALFGSGGYCAFADSDKLSYILALLNSKATGTFISYVSPTLNYEVGHIKTIPVVIDESYHERIDELVNENITIAKKEWDSFETSWDFEEHPFIRWSHDLCNSTIIDSIMHKYYGNCPTVKCPLELCFLLWQVECQERIHKLKKNEEEINSIFINIYGLHNELTPEVEDQQITLRRAELQRDVRSFVSYLVGVVMGRYSLGKTGLAYAGGKWDETNYMLFNPDDDGIVPIYNGVGMEDGLTGRIIEVIKLIFGEETLRSNLDYIADGLGKQNNESSAETLNRYLNDTKKGFYANHKKMYQNRPIYWMFSSGENKGFKCLVYMHRYNKDTLARINAKYYLPESTRQKIGLEELDNQIKTADGKERIRLEKSRTKLFDKYNETIEYGQVLDHMANKYIDIDLDDGVKVNYAKFQGVELVSDNGMKIKKDLLVPLK